MSPETNNPQPEHPDLETLGQIVRRLSVEEILDEAPTEELSRQRYMLDLLAEVADLRSQKIDLIERRRSGEDIDPDAESGITQAMLAAQRELDQFGDIPEHP